MSSIYILFLFIILAIIFSLTGYLLLKIKHPQIWKIHLAGETIQISGSILAAVSLLVSVPLSFIIVYIWNDYHDTILLIQKKAALLRILYNDISRLGNAELTTMIKLYINNLIHGKDDIMPLRNALNNYPQIMTLMNELYLINNSIYSFTRISVEVWTVIGLGVLILIISTWFVRSPIVLHIFLMIAIASIIASLVFLVYLHSNVLDHNDPEVKQIYKNLLR